MIPYRLKTALAVASFTLAAASAPASAAVVQVFSNNLAGWQAAVGGPVVVEDFADAALTAGFSITFGTSLPGAISGGIYGDRADNDSTNPQLNFAPGVTAFGADWDLAGPGGIGTGIALFITFVSGATLALTDEIPSTFGGDFFGIVSDTAIASIRIDEGTQPGGSETFNMDNARLVVGGSSTPVPEPTTLALLGAALLGIGAAARRRRVI